MMFRRRRKSPPLTLTLTRPELEALAAMLGAVGQIVQHLGCLDLDGAGLERFGRLAAVAGKVHRKFGMNDYAAQLTAMSDQLLAASRELNRSQLT